MEISHVPVALPPSAEPFLLATTRLEHALTREVRRDEPGLSYQTPKRFYNVTTFGGRWLVKHGNAFGRAAGVPLAIVGSVATLPFTLLLGAFLEDENCGMTHAPKSPGGLRKRAVAHALEMARQDLIQEYQVTQYGVVVGAGFSFPQARAQEQAADEELEKWRRLPNRFGKHKKPVDLTHLSAREVQRAELYFHRSIMRAVWQLHGEQQKLRTMLTQADDMAARGAPPLGYVPPIPRSAPPPYSATAACELASK